MKLQDKTIVITGGTSGIGYQMVRLLSSCNTVLVVARPGARLEVLKKELPQVSTFTADLAKPKVYDALADQILSSHSQIDILINNAAVQHTPRYLDDSFAYETIAHEVNLNFTAICALSYLLLPGLLSEERDAAIININSGLGLAPKTSSAVYCATKAALNAFSQSLSYQFEDTNIRVLQAFLPLVDTPMTAGRGDGKISAEHAAKDVLAGIEREAKFNDVGKVKLMRMLLVIAPWLVRKIMKGS